MTTDKVYYESKLTRMNSQCGLATEGGVCSLAIAFTIS